MVEEKFHALGDRHDCPCEPEIINLGFDGRGSPARVYVHEGRDFDVGNSNARPRN